MLTTLYQMPSQCGGAAGMWCDCVLASVGSVVYVRVCVGGSVTGDSRGLAFVRYKYGEDSQKALQDYAEYMGYVARVVLVPSLRDAYHDFVFPQPAFDIHSDLKNQITRLTNPGLFDANKVNGWSLPTYAKKLDILMQSSTVKERNFDL
ncbi:hypothetical protein IFM89_034806 [Coptis chinensis]|uniref:DNA polymerase alpha subunit B n=1 Tax=Coptis chinensis TaxID=261450 RepID=A0A835HDE1_9MAGN|nr:hypothetical protein IFM89_034806 [Coptis chinensis]